MLVVVVFIWLFVVGKSVKEVFVCVCVCVCVCVKPAAFCVKRPCDLVQMFRNPPSHVRQQIFSEIL